MGDGVTGVARRKAEHEGKFDDPVNGMRDETGPATSKEKGSEGHARNSALTRS